MKKILHIITRLDRGGSSEDVMFNLVHCRNKGHEVKVVYGTTRYPSAPFIKEQEEHPSAFILLPQLVRAVNPFCDIVALARLYAVISREKPDILHTHTAKAGILGRWAGWLYKKVTGNRVVIIHSTHGHVFYGYYPASLSRLFVIAEKITASITDRIVTLTDNEAAEHLSRGIGRAGQFAVVHSGLDQQIVFSANNVRGSLGLGPSAMLIGSAGRLDPVKGYRYFIDAVGIIEKKRPGLCCTYLLVGDGAERTGLEQLARAYGLQGKLVFAGWQEKVDDYIAAMDIFVQPSLNEGLGKTVLLAQTLRRPVIATSVQGLVALVKDGATGLLVPPANAPRLADAMLRLIDNAAERATLGVAAQQQAFQRDPGTQLLRYSVENMNYRLERVYEA